MSYSCCDFASDISGECERLGLLKTDLLPEDEYGDGTLSAEADQILEALPRIMAEHAAMRAALEEAYNFISDRGDEKDEEEDHLLATLEAALPKAREVSNAE